MVAEKSEIVVVLLFWKLQIIGILFQNTIIFAEIICTSENCCNHLVHFISCIYGLICLIQTSH